MCCLSDRHVKFYVAPVRERGLKYCLTDSEILGGAVAPVRERGLKYVFGGTVRAGAGRSREGAWIEIKIRIVTSFNSICRSREGAWIEICLPAF
mgnify:CR=1 FL=1